MDERPRLIAPPGACDCHMHVFEQRFLAPEDTRAIPVRATAAMYREVQAVLGLQRVIVVQANMFGSDNRGMLEAMAESSAQARGVVVIEPDVDDAELQRLTNLGVRGVRFHMLPGGHLHWAQLDAVAARVRPFGWHVQLQCNGWELPQHAEQLARLPVDVVVDHLGKFLDPAPPAVDDPAFGALLRLLDGGRCWVKLSAPYESSRRDAPDYADVAPLARALVASHPERCLWASNWPHPGRMPTPSDALMLDQLLAWADDDTTRHRILADNPAALYGFSSPESLPSRTHP